LWLVPHESKDLTHALPGLYLVALVTDRVAVGALDVDALFVIERKIYAAVPWATAGKLNLP
jgi:hypothetical protein